jgi:hypothetical protein
MTFQVTGDRAQGTGGGQLQFTMHNSQFTIAGGFLLAWNVEAFVEIATRHFVPLAMTFQVTGHRAQGTGGGLIPIRGACWKSTTIVNCEL